MKASRSRGRGSPKTGAPSGGRPSTSAGSTDARIVHMKPQRTAMIVLLLIFLVWLGVLLALYFRTIYHREGEDDPARGAGWTAWVGGAEGARVGAAPPAEGNLAGGPLISAR